MNELDKTKLVFNFQLSIKILYYAICKRKVVLFVIVKTENLSDHHHST